MAKREAVWWACRCVADALVGEPPAPVARALDAVKAWVADPTDDNRRACWPAAEAAEIGYAGRLHGHGRLLQRRQPRPAEPARGPPRASTSPPGWSSAP